MRDTLNTSLDHSCPYRNGPLCLTQNMKEGNGGGFEGGNPSLSHASSEGGVVVVSENMGDERGQGFDMLLHRISD